MNLVFFKHYMHKHKGCILLRGTGPNATEEKQSHVYHITSDNSVFPTLDNRAPCYSSFHWNVHEYLRCHNTGTVLQRTMQWIKWILHLEDKLPIKNVLGRVYKLFSIICYFVFQIWLRLIYMTSMCNVLPALWILHVLGYIKTLQCK